MVGSGSGLFEVSRNLCRMTEGNHEKPQDSSSILGPLPLCYSELFMPKKNGFTLKHCVVPFTRYVCMRGGPQSGPCTATITDLLCFPFDQSFINPTLTMKCRLCLWGCQSSYLVPWRTGPGDEILNELQPHNHIGYVWPIHLLLGTFHKWDHPPIPDRKGVPLDDSVLWIVLSSILIGLCLISTDLLFFWQKALI
jgi:hypothetical protein